MTFNSADLNNIASSKGQTNLWVYITDDAMATVQVAGYANEAVKYGMKNNDCMLISTSNGGSIVKCEVNVDKQVTIVSLDSF